MNDPDQNVDFIFGETNNYHESRNSYLEFDLTVRNPAANLDNTSGIRLLKTPYAHCFKEVSLGTTGGIEIEHVKFSGQTSTIMRSINSIDGDLLLQFDIINDGDTNASINNTSLKENLIGNHTVVANKGKMKS